jgi:succinoglycan biosynthesis transport protein ExoP
MRSVPRGKSDLIGRTPGLRASASPQTEDGGTGATLRAFLGVVRRRLPILLVCAIVVPAATLFWSLQQEKEYSSSASLLFRSAKLDQSLTGSTFFSSSGDATRTAQTNVELVSLGVVATRTAQRLDEPGVTPGLVGEAVSVSLQGESDVASVKATVGDPALAARIANVFAHEYIAVRREAEQRTVLTARDRVEGQLEEMTPEQRAGSQGQRLSKQAEELDVLASLQTGNAEVVQPATPNGAPVSPHPTRNAVLGLIVGVLLGVGLILLLEQFDTRIKDEAGVEDAYGLPILAKIPHGSRGRSPEASDPIGLGTPGAEAFRMLHANLRYFNVDRKIDSLLVTSAAPGEGKTTVSWGLSVTEARGGKSVLLVEADMRQPTLASRDGGDPSSALSLVLAGVDTLENAVVPVDLGSATETDLHVLLAGPIPPNSAELLESTQMSALLEEARGRYDLVVIDTPPIVVADAIALMPQVSGVLVVARLRHSRRDAARDLHELLTNLDALPLGTVANDAVPAREGYYVPYAGHAGATV